MDGNHFISINNPLLKSFLFIIQVPNSSVWPLNSDWDFHCGNSQGKFRTSSRCIVSDLCCL